MSGHTPGPWEWTVEVLDEPARPGAPFSHFPKMKEVPWDGKREDLRQLRRAGTGGDFIVAGIWRTDSDADVMVSSPADAHLIAAAPELLTALKLTVLKVTLEGAEGDAEWRPILRRAEAAIAKAEASAATLEFPSRPEDMQRGEK